MIVEGQIMGGLTEGFRVAAMELITFDEDGNCIGSNFMDYLIPTAWETAGLQLGETVAVAAPSDRREGWASRRPSAHAAAFVNAIVDARARGRAQLRDAGDVGQVWQALNEVGLAGEPGKCRSRRAAGRGGRPVRARHRRPPSSGSRRRRGAATVRS